MAHVTTLSIKSIRRLPRSYIRHQRICHPSQTRSLWGCSHQRHHNNHDLYKRHIRILLNDHQPIRRPTRRDRDPNQHITYRSSWRSPESGWGFSDPGWAWSSSSASSKSEFPRSKHSAGHSARHRKRYDDGGFFEDRARKHIQWIKREVERDPYEVVFGRRLDPFGLGSTFKLENGFTSFCRSFLGLDKDAPKSMKGTDTDTKGTLDTTATTVSAKGETRDTSGGKKEKPKRENVKVHNNQDPWSLEKARRGLQFDPISGRMAPNRPESKILPDDDKVRHTSHSNSVESKSKPELVSRRKKSDSKLQEPLKQENDNRSNNGMPTTFESPGLTEKESWSMATSHDQTSTSSSAQKAPDSKSDTIESPKLAEDAFQSTDASQGRPSNPPSAKQGFHEILEALGISQNAIQAESSQIESRIVSQAQPEDASSTAVSQDGADQPSRSVQQHNQADPKTSASKHRKSKDDLERAGFLSRRNKEGLASTNSDGTQSRARPDNSNDNLDYLRASDIRAAYDSRRLSIRSEIEAEAPKGMNKPISHTRVDVDDHPILGADQKEVPMPSSHKSLDADSDEAATKSILEESKHPSSRISDMTADVDYDSILGAHLSKTNSANRFSGAPAAEPSIKPALKDSLSKVEATTSVNEARTSETYRVFAYDPSSQQVTEAETNSSLHASSEHIHPTDVLSHLKSPAKFLPCLSQMHAEGYEIVSGGKDILVFRKAPAVSSSDSQYQMGESTRRSINDLVGKLPASQPAYHKPYTGSLSENPSAGQSRKDAPKGRVRNAFRRMFIGGAATAGTCYAIGVVAEYFRTGGEDGWGVDGFTVFESERRHREQ